MAAKVYRTIQGDSFDAISYRLFKNVHYVRELMEANPEYMDILLFEPGIELKIPEIKKKDMISDLPPWYEA